MHLRSPPSPKPCRANVCGPRKRYPWKFVLAGNALKMLSWVFFFPRPRGPNGVFFPPAWSFPPTKKVFVARTPPEKKKEVAKSKSKILGKKTARPGAHSFYAPPPGGVQISPPSIPSPNKGFCFPAPPRFWKFVVFFIGPPLFVGGAPPHKLIEGVWFSQKKKKLCGAAHNVSSRVPPRRGPNSVCENTVRQRPRKALICPWKKRARFGTKPPLSQRAPPLAPPPVGPGAPRTPLWKGGPRHKIESPRPARKSERPPPNSLEKLLFLSLWLDH